MNSFEGFNNPLQKEHFLENFIEGSIWIATYVPKNQLAPGYRNSLSIGFDIETGGHVFQLHFTNATSMIEKGFVTKTSGDWWKGDIHFGFYVSWVFTIVKPKLKNL